MDGGQITRASVGRVAYVGDLYDARSEKFCGISILKKQPPPTALRVTDNSACDVQFVHSDTFAEKFEKLGITAELRLSILAGALVLEGHGQYLNDKKKSARSVRSSLLYTVNTKLEHLNLSSEDLKDCLELNALKDNQATHVVIDVYWGATATITVESMNSESKDVKEVEGALSAELNRIACKVSGKAEVDYKQKEEKKETSFSLHVFADVLSAGDLPQTVEKATELMKKIPTLVQEVNDGKGKPIQYMMAPISALNHFLNEAELLADRLVKQLDEGAIVRFVQVFDEISEVKQELNDLYNDMVSHKFCVQEKDIKKVDETRTKLNQAEANLRSKLATTLIEVRSGRAGAEQLENIQKEFEDGNFSLSKVRSDINSFHKTIEKIKFADILAAEGVTYIGLGISIETEKIKSGTSDIYVLFFSDTLKKTDKQLWSDNLHLFLSLVRSTKSNKSGTRGSNKFIIVDLDIRPEVSTTECVGEGIKICHYKNGRYINCDVLAENEAKKSLCFAKSNQSMDAVAVKPNKRAQLELKCAGSLSGLCLNENRKWTCIKCEELIEYGFDSFFYCSCGRALAKSYVFKCCNDKHGIDFVSFPSELLEYALRWLRPMKELNILILGPTGVGKSTWLNGIVNYMTYSTLEEAERHMKETDELVHVIPASFTVTNENFEECPINVGKDANEVLDVKGQSATQDPKSYVVKLKNTLFRFIDTPGIGDTRGLDQDRKNLNRILKFISNLDELHGICILLKPNDSRIDVMFRFCIKELLTHLHRNASKNIVFCFTNARGTFYRPGDTLPILRKLLKEINVEIAIAMPTIYCLDNEAFRFLCTLKHGIKYGPEDHKNYSASWDKAVMETDRMFIHIASLTPHPIHHTTSLNNARDIIMSLTEPMAEISRNIQINIAIVKDKELEIINSTESEKELEKRLKIPQLFLESIPLGYPRTVCTHECCIKLHKLDGKTVIENVTYCHEHCGLNGVIPERYPNPDLQHCAAMDVNLNCKNCNHCWDKHMHVRNEYKHKTKEVIDDSVQNQINTKKSARQKIEDHIQSLKKRVSELENEQKKITEISAKFGHFLKTNAITPYNDALKDYLDYLIDQEKTKACKTEVDKKTLNGLEKMKLAYEHEVTILTQAMGSKQNLDITPEDIQNLEQQLYTLPINGEQLRQCMAASVEAKAQMMNYIEHHYSPKYNPQQTSSKHEEKSNGWGVGQKLKWLGRQVGVLN